MQNKIANRYIYLEPANNRHGYIEDTQLSLLTERHKHSLPMPGKFEDGGGIEYAIANNTEISGVAIQLEFGIPYKGHLQMAKQAMARGVAVWFWWPLEGVVESVTEERLQSFRRHRSMRRCVRVGSRIGKLCQLQKLPRRAKDKLKRLSNRVARYGFNKFPDLSQKLQENDRVIDANHLEQAEADLRLVANRVAPIPFAKDADQGSGIYLRTDFWAKIYAGGSYGHTCYVAKELAARGSDLVCLMPHRYDLLDDLNLRQLIIDEPFSDWPELHIAQATQPCFQALKLAVKLHQAGFIYERLVLGNFTGAKLSQELGIPYIVEYNGSEISMRRSFEGTGYLHESFYLAAEHAAFRQATLISVISEPVKEDLVSRGIDANRILVNPNGADPDAYKALDPNSKQRLRTELGFAENDVVVGFTGTFGGWHGIDVLAEGLPKICKAHAKVRFLLIGDGNFKHLIDDAIKTHGLEKQVQCMGRVPQQEGGRLLGACDIYISPHSSHMKDRAFFGSPTKLFEYMAMGGAIVASDLEQIGQVLSPALRADRLSKDTIVEQERSILCEPGNVEEFISALNFLIDSPQQGQQLGNNARQAILDQLSWKCHVDRLWRAAFGESIADLQSEALDGRQSPSAPTKIGGRIKINTGDAFKDQTQEQWNNDACGSHYVKESLPDTFEWYREAEEYRFGTYAPWMPEMMEFSKHADHDVLEIGAGMGTDLSQFAAHGARVTDVDLSAGHLAHAKRNFELRKLQGRFVHHDAETLPFDDNSFDLVYSNGVIHHTPNTQKVVEEIFRVLRPGGKAVLMVYAENSLHYWRNLFFDLGIKQQQLDQYSMGEIMSQHVEISENGQRPLVKVYSKRRLRELMTQFTKVEVHQRQMVPSERPKLLSWLPTTILEKVAGWNLIVKATKPQ